VKPVVAVCTPTVHDRQRSLEWAERYRQVCATLPEGWFPLRQKHYLVDRARQVLAEEAIARGATHVLWWDDDCIPPVDGALRLLHWRYPWATGCYVDRLGRATLGLFLPDQQQALKPVDVPRPGEVGWYDACGLGFCLLETTLLARLGRDAPWFRFEVFPDGRYVGEDFYLARRLSEGLGLRVLADGDVVVGQEELCVHRPDGRRIPVWEQAGMEVRL
jgi:hypothetical protein